MNKTVFVGSAILLVLGMGTILLPFPGPWLMPFLVGTAWIWVALYGKKTSQTVPLVVPEPARPSVVEVPSVVSEVREILPLSLTEDIHRYRASLDVLKGLKNLVIADTEGAVLRLTEALFTLVQNSKDVSSHIEKSLTFITDGDSGLGRTVANLEEQVRVFEVLATHFTQLKEGLVTDIGALTQAVGSINQFSETLSDLADQTNVLAINASIEAARVGIHGRGFAVIASQVQNLAKNSKEISEKMARTVQDVVSSVESSFSRQTQRISESDGLILNSEQELKKWAAHVGPQLVEIRSMIGESRRLAEVVTGELNDVTVSLQFQDRTRQVLDHMAEVLEDTSRRIVVSAGQEGVDIPAPLRESAHQEASKHFTVQEEWALLSAKHQGSRAGKSVELF